MARRPIGSTRRSLTGVLALAAAVLAACASIPTSGPVHQGVAVNNNSGTSQIVGIIAQPAFPGMSPQDVVEGFLLAAASFDGDHAVARTFLTSAASSGWNPSAGVTIYGNSRLPRISAPVGDVVTLTAPRIGTITAQGTLSSAPGTVNVQFRMKKVLGQWRIESLPPGLLLTSADVARAYEPLDLYFPDPQHRVLVPDQVLVPRGSGQATSLVQALLAGPTAWLSSAVRTAFPPGTRLAVNSVPVENGRADVDLTTQAEAVSGPNGDAMTAQLIWTLGQINVTAVRILVAGAVIRVVNVSDPRFTRWSPNSTGQQATVYFIRAGGVYSVQAPGRVAPVPGPAGNGSLHLSDPAVSYDQSEVAALANEGGALDVGRIGVKNQIDQVAHGYSFTAPSWDIFGQVWYVDRRPAGKGRWDNVVWTVSLGGQPIRVGVTGLPSGRVVGLRISPDGVRVAVLVATNAGSTVYVGRIVRGEKGTAAVSGFQVVDSRLSDIGGVSWANADDLLLLAGATPQPIVITLTGATVQSFVAPIALPSGASPVIVQVSQTATQPVIAATRDGRLWQYTGFQWQSVGAGSDPTYPG
jgi:Lipoprotein LpqB beta-propeller domain/Sporulation and spore germination